MAASLRSRFRARGLLPLVSALLVTTFVLTAGPTGAAPRKPAGADVRGSIKYFFVPSLHSRPFGITPGPDGNLWFTDTDSSMIGRITPSGDVMEFDIGSGKKPYGIVTGADGNLWFTEELNNKIGVMDTDGNLLHEYYAPAVDARPAGITAGPDGNIWFVEMGSGEDITNAVGRVTLDGTVTVFPLFGCACFPIGVTTGPDGNLWATEELGAYNGDSTGTIDRITPDGKTIDRYPVPLVSGTESHLPAFIAAGPDGNVWFTEYNASLHRIGRVKPNGHITEFTLPGDFTNSASITTGPDGRLWITQADAGDIAVVRSSGAFVKSFPTHHEPTGITIGPDGNMWFALSLDGEIGRLKTARSGYAYVLDIASGFVPARRTVDLGTTVEWILEAPGLHRVKDVTGLGLYDSGRKPPVSFQLFTFTAAGTYRYKDGPGGESGKVGVPADAPSTGQAGVAFDVTWATTAPPSGLVFDVQVKVPGSNSWQPWQSGVTSLSAGYTPGAPGTYAFRARVRQAAGSAKSGWSPAIMVTVS